MSDLGWLELKNINNVQNNAYRPNNSYDSIVDEYHDVFEGLGCLPGKYHITIDPNVQPVQHYLRNVAVVLKSELKNKK